MILLHVRTKTKVQAEDIADYLIDEKFILSAVIFKEVNVRERNGDTGEMESRHEYLMTGKTKALLFSEIDKRLRMRFSENLPVIYALPIAGMDWEQADELVEKTTKI